MTVGTRSMNSSRVSLPVECNFRLVKNGEAVEVGDEDMKLFLVLMFVFMFMFNVYNGMNSWLSLLCVRVSSFVICVFL